MKKSMKVIASLLAVVLLFMSPSPTYAMSQQNTIAHQALKKQIIADKRKYCNWVRPKIKYVYADIDGDHVSELITEPGYGYLTQAIYDYQNGKVKNVASVGQGSFTKYYPKHKVLYVKNSGHMGVLCDYYYKYVNGTYKLVACAEKDLKTTYGSECALTSLAVDEPLEYARLYLEGNLQMWVDAEDSLELY